MQLRIYTHIRYVVLTPPFFGLENYRYGLGSSGATSRTKRHHLTLPLDLYCIYPKLGVPSLSFTTKSLRPLLPEGISSGSDIGFAVGKHMDITSSSLVKSNPPKKKEISTSTYVLSTQFEARGILSTTTPSIVTLGFYYYYVPLVAPC
jgi:hypothetical protein